MTLIMTLHSFYNAGYKRGLEWIGPNGDGSLGFLSMPFIREEAEILVTGRPFRDLKEVTEEEKEAADLYVDGFHAGRVDQP